ncbi:MAG: hypothetical protein U0271_35125 [Polyangiaceae bacterium]
MPDEPRPRRHLPVLNQSGGDGAAPEQATERPPHEWAIASGVVTLVVWVVLMAVVSAVLANRAVAPLLVVGASATSVIVAAGLAGLLLGKFSTRCSARHASYGALGAVVFGWVIAMRSPAGASPVVWLLTLGALVGLAAAGSLGGFKLGRKKPASRAG